MVERNDEIFDQILADQTAYAKVWSYDGEFTQGKRIMLNERIRRVFIASKRCVVQILVPLSGTFGFAINDSTAEGDSGMFIELMPLPPGTLIRFPLEENDFLVMATQEGSFPIGLIAMPRTPQTEANG